MRYYCFSEPVYDSSGLIGSEIVTWSEDDVREKYYPHWLKQMYEKFGKQYVDENYSFEDCLDQWIVVNWAWESGTNE